MYTIKFVKLMPSTVCIILTWAQYSEGEIEDILISRIKELIFTKKGTNECLGEAMFNEVVKEVHELFLKNGNSGTYRDKYVRQGFKWYKSYCELVLINTYKSNCEDYFEFAYVGQLPLYLYNKFNKSLQSINYIHNIKNEVAKNTIEESCLSPFYSVSSKDLAKQIMPDESNEVIEMVANYDKETFINRFSHSLTRCVGYFQKSGSEKISDYRINAPTVTYGYKKFEDEDLIVFYKPENSDIIPFSEEKLNEIVKSKFQNKIKDSQELRDFSEIKNGDIILIDIINNAIEVKLF